MLTRTIQDEWAKKAKLDIDDSAKWARLRLDAKVATARTKIDMKVKRKHKSVQARRAVLRQQRVRDKEFAKERAQEEGAMLAELMNTLLGNTEGQTGKTCCRNEQHITSPASDDSHDPPSVGLGDSSTKPALRSYMTPDGFTVWEHFTRGSAPQSSTPQALPAASERSCSRSAAPSPEPSPEPMPIMRLLDTGEYWEDQPDLYTYMIGPQDIVLRDQALTDPTEDDYDLDCFYLVNCPKSCLFSRPDITLDQYLAHLDYKHPRSDDTRWTRSDALIEGCNLILDADNEWFSKKRLGPESIGSQDSVNGKEPETQNEPVASSMTVNRQLNRTFLEDGHGSLEHEKTPTGQKRQREEDGEYAEVDTPIRLKKSRTTGSAMSFSPPYSPEPASEYHVVVVDTVEREHLTRSKYKPFVPIETAGRHEEYQVTPRADRLQFLPALPYTEPIQGCSQCPYNGHSHLVQESPIKKASHCDRGTSLRENGQFY